MAGTTKAAEKAVQEPVEAKVEANVEANVEVKEDAKKGKVYKLRSSNKYLTVSSLGVQFMAGKYETTDPAITKALLTLDGVELLED